jgi:hypothetical protein
MNDGRTNVYYSKFDIAGPVEDSWGDGSYLTLGDESGPFVRRLTFNSVNQMFTGMTRTTYVRGVWAEKYYPGGVSDGSIIRDFYVADYNYTQAVGSMPGVYLPDPSKLRPILGVNQTSLVGAGPYYASVRMANTNSSLVIFHPLLSDQSGARVRFASIPKMRLYQSGYLIGTYYLEERLVELLPERIVSLHNSGSYVAKISVPGDQQVCSDNQIELGFSIPSADVNPPRITGLSMPQRFIPGQKILLEVAAIDDGSGITANLSWRPRGTTSWQGLPVTINGAGSFAASISTSTSDTAIDLLMRFSDSSGNYVQYMAVNASEKQIPVRFDLVASPVVVPFVNDNVSIMLTGHLTKSDGTPISSRACVPLDMMVNGKKVGMILDEYVSGSSHDHNGTIRFEWLVNPMRLFTQPNQAIDVEVSFDLGTYEPVKNVIRLQSQKMTNDPPIISLLSPGNGTLIASGTIVDLNVQDDGPFTVDATVDGTSIGQLHSPWNVETTSWNDGIHVLRIVAVDDQYLTTSASFSFDVDAQAPYVRIFYPKDGGRVPIGAVLTAEVSDMHLKDVYYSADCGPALMFASPYTIDMSIWAPGNHTVIITALDSVDHLTSRSVSFEVVNSSIAVQLENPANGGVLRSSIPITFSVSGSGTITSRWCTAGVWQELGGLMTIPTDGWFEGVHSIIINSTSDLGGFDQATFTVTIDDTTPVIQLNSPSNNSFVSPSDNIRFQVFDANIQIINWTIWDRSGSTVQWETVIPLASPPSDGYFSVSVTVVDKAGNEANASFMFAMDSSPPVVSFEDWSSGDAIRPGYQLNFTATDVFLSMVQCAIDSDALAEMSSPFAVNTSSLSGGIHQLTVVASDLSGKKTTANISFYVDAVAPNALITSSPRMTLNATCTVTAKVSDDYGIGVVLLFYELRAGGYGSVMMAGYDGVYIAELAPDLLWKGMTIYVLATDKVGNVAESPRMTLQSTTSPFDGNLPLSGSPSGWGAAMWAWIVSTSGLAISGLIGVIALAGFVLYARSRREDESTERTIRPKPSPKGVSNASPFAELPPPKPIATASARQIVDSVKAAAKTVGQVPIPTRVPSAVASGSGAPARVMLLDSIPEITLKPDVVPPEDDIDYGELIERELNASAWKNSAFGKGIGDSAVNREFDARPDRPGIISGLKLMKIME